MSDTMSEKEIPEAWVGQRVRVGHAHSASTHTDGVLLGVGDRGIVVEGGELVRFYPWTYVGRYRGGQRGGGGRGPWPPGEAGPVAPATQE